jgi:HPt (histidine-containing phosphotransfer) domain-containing protein
MSLNLGANMLGQLCEEIEDLANGGKMSDVDPLLPKLQKLFDQTHAEFNQILVSERGRGA